MEAVPYFPFAVIANGAPIDSILLRDLRLPTEAPIAIGAGGGKEKKETLWQKEM